MRVIFLVDVPRVGKRYDIKEVNDGYAMNFLLPRKLARVATPKAVAEIETHQKEITIEKEVQENLLLKNLEEIKGKTITIKAKADEKGHLFSGIHKKEIKEALHVEHRAEVSEEFIVLPKPIKEVGEHEIQIAIKDKQSSFKLVVEAE